MISYQGALSILREVGASQKLESERISLMDSLGRILDQSIESPEDVPSFTNSAMDGFAVLARDTLGATKLEPIRIPVQGLVAAGDLQAYEKANQNPRDSATEIMTGAPLPTDRYDSVVRIEDVQVVRDVAGQAEMILITKPIRPMENVRPRGTDYQKNQGVIAGNTRLTAGHFLACTSLGVTSVLVKKLPKVVIVSTGSELVPPGTKDLSPGMIRNSTGPFLWSALKSFGMNAQFLGIVRDEPTTYRKVLEQALSDGAEMIISTGAVSMGKFDFVSDVLNDLRATPYFHKVAIRPGKPFLFAEIGSAHGKKCAFFGVPGNPVSTVVGLRFFIEPFLRARLGLNEKNASSATLIESCQKPEGLKCFFKGRATVTKNGLEVKALKGQASYMVSTLLDANCWVILEETGAEAVAGSTVQIAPLQSDLEMGGIL